jgi:hypothetical protein
LTKYEEWKDITSFKRNKIFVSTSVLGWKPVIYSNVELELPLEVID